MRLHSLTVQAFQAFAGTETVDFDALTADGLFLLRGETGAGKTTILDAVCFALYGGLPGARAKDARVRSDHAAADLRTEVVLEATLRGERIRVTRTPKQERPKSRGEGTTEDAATVQVAVIAADGASRVIATRHEDADSELDDRLGLTLSQFSQVVLLPQGEFATFLRAGSDERKKLLTDLFSAERFEHAEKWLKDRASDAHRRADEALDGVSDVVSRAAEFAGEDAPDDWRSAPQELVAWLQGRVVIADAERETAVAVRDAAAAAAASAESLANIAVTQQERRDRHAVAVAGLAEVTAQEPEQAARRAELDRALAAAAVAPALLEATQRSAQLRDAEQQVVARRERLGDDDRDHDVAGLTARALAVRDAAGATRALAGVEESVLARRAERTAALATATAAGRVADEALRWLDGAAAERALIERDAQLAATAESGLAALTDDAGRAEERVVAARRRDEAIDDAQRRDEVVAVLRKRELDAQSHWLDLRQQRLEGMAAELADGLVDGEACAVCGSTEHPNPAGTDGDAVRVTAEDEAAAQSEYQASREEYETAERALVAAQRALTAAAAVAGEVPRAELELIAAEHAAALQDARAVAASAAEAVARLQAHDAEVARRTAERTEHVARGSAEQARADELTVSIAADEARLTAALDGAPSVAAAVAALDSVAEALDAAREAIAAAQTAAVEAHQSAEAASARAVDAGFDGIDGVAAAVRDEASIALLKALVREHDERVVECRTQASDATLVAASEQDAPDVEAAQAAAQAAKGELATTEHRAANTDRDWGSLASLARTLDERLETLAPLLEERALVRGLASLADGTSTANRKRMRLSAFVLAARLEEIAIAATARLTTMSAGRYALVHSDEGGGRKRQHGLDLKVVDNWTGHERHPSTLSGGETFLASLALALGLADVVAAEAGGARLETFFVDEGFGSLDDGTLDDVLDVLDRLRDGGRMIGVVSHVAELRQRITSQLHVVKGRDGSHVRVGAPA